VILVFQIPKEDLEDTRNCVPNEKLKTNLDLPQNQQGQIRGKHLGHDVWAGSV
jgi:hypothetical protein